MDGSERREALDTKSAWFHQSTGWPLSPYTVYHLGIKGQKIPYKIGAIVPASVNCTTRGVYIVLSNQYSHSLLRSSMISLYNV